MLGGSVVRVSGRGYTSTSQPILCRFGGDGSSGGEVGAEVGVAGGYSNWQHPLTSVATVVSGDTLLCVTPPAARAGKVSLVVLVNGLALALVPTTPSTPLSLPPRGLVFSYVPPPVISSLLPAAGPLAGDPPLTHLNIYHLRQVTPLYTHIYHPRPLYLSILTDILVCVCVFVS